MISILLNLKFYPNHGQATEKPGSNFQVTTFIKINYISSLSYVARYTRVLYSVGGGGGVIIPAMNPQYAPDYQGTNVS